MEEMDYPSVSLTGKIALVTGAAQGMGKWIALGLANAGADIAVADLNLEGARQTAKEIEALGRKALPLKTDIASMDSIKEMVGKTIETFSHIDCLVNNAGVNVHKPFLEITPEEFDFIAGVNFRGVYFVSQVVSKEMINAGFNDSFREIHPSLDYSSPSITAERLSWRIDYIYYKGEKLKAVSSDMHFKYKGIWPSDHPTVITTLSINE